MAGRTLSTVWSSRSASSDDSNAGPEFYQLLGGGQRDAGLDGSLRSPNRLAIIPNTTHYTLLGSAAVTEFASDFLKPQ